jgi:broad specificity phosphatase PhoE
MNLLIIRHAESANNRIIATLGYDDYLGGRHHEPPLTDTGEAQAERLAEHLVTADQLEFSRKGKETKRGYGIDRLFCSPMLRTLQTAYPTAQALNLPLEIWRDTFEHGGLFEGDPFKENGAGLKFFPGMGRSAMMERFPGVVVPEPITDEGWYAGGYEELAGCAARAVTVAEELTTLAAENPDLTIALVTHGTFINQLLHRVLGVGTDSPMYFFHANTGITRVEFGESGFRVLRYLNRLEHLPSNLWTR